MCWRCHRATDPRESSSAIRPFAEAGRAGAVTVARATRPRSSRLGPKERSERRFARSLTSGRGGPRPTALCGREPFALQPRPRWPMRPHTGSPALRWRSSGPAPGLPISRLPIRMLQHAGFCCHAIPLEHLVDPSLYRLPIPSGATGTLSAPVIRSQLARRLPRHDPTVGSAAESRPRRVMRYLGIEHAWGGAIGDLGPRTATGSSRLKISAPSPRRGAG